MTTQPAAQPGATTTEATESDDPRTIDGRPSDPAEPSDTAVPGSTPSDQYGRTGPGRQDTRWYPPLPPRELRIRRSATDKMLAGVCGGIAQHTDIDPVYIRLAFLVSLFWGGIGIFAYIAAAVVMPKPDPSAF